MKKLALIFFLSLTVIAVNGQESGSKNPGLKVNSFSGSMGFAGVNVSNTFSDYNSLKANVEDPDIFVDADGLSESKYNIGFGGNGVARFYLGLTPYSKKKNEYRDNQELRFSLGTAFGTRRMFNYYQVSNSTIDTFQSPATGAEVYADSSVYDRYLYTENFYDVSVGVSYLFKTNMERRFHFYAGAGLEFGISLRSFARLDHYNEQTVIYYEKGDQPSEEEPDMAIYGYYDNDMEGTTTRYTTNMLGTTMFVRTFIPFGINFRIARKPQSFFNKVFLFTEAGPGVEFQITGNEKTYVNPYFGVAILGFTYRW